MKMKDILKLTAALLNLEINVDIEKDDTALLVKLVNLVISEIASAYVPLLTTEEAAVKDGKLSFSALSKKPLDIKSVLDRDGARLKFKQFPSYLEINAERVKIVYTYLPAACALEGEIDLHDKITDRILAYGAASEYCAVQGMFDEAKMWEAKYYDALTAAARSGTEIRILARSWR